jgi:hypothetical protein
MHGDAPGPIPQIAEKVNTQPITATVGRFLQNHMFGDRAPKATSPPAFLGSLAHVLGTKRLDSRFSAIPPT